MKNCFCYFRNVECRYFPCHQVEDREDFNCMFCYCPLYHLEDCGGKASLNKNGIKDCSECLLPHKAENYQYIMEKLSE